MNAVAVGLSAGGLATVLGTWALYMSTIPRGKVPVRALGTFVFQCLGMGLAISGVVWSLRSDGSPDLVASAAAVLSLLMGLSFFWLFNQRKTPIGDLKLSVGDPLLPFEATTSEGVTFKTDELAGKRILLKFFRGGW